MKYHFSGEAHNSFNNFFFFSLTEVFINRSNQTTKCQTFMEDTVFLERNHFESITWRRLSPVSMANIGLNLNNERRPDVH